MMKLIRLAQRHDARVSAALALLLGLLWWPETAHAEQLRATTTASGNTAASPHYQARIAAGEAVVGLVGSATQHALLGFLASLASPQEATPPTGTIVINGGAVATNRQRVTLTLLATDTDGLVSVMRFSPDGTTYTAPEPYATTKAWTLTTGEGPKTVFVQFADPSGHWSAPVQATITLDTTPPHFTITTPRDGAVIGIQ